MITLVSSRFNKKGKCNPRSLNGILETSFQSSLCSFLDRTRQHHKSPLQRIFPRMGHITMKSLARARFSLGLQNQIIIASNQISLHSIAMFLCKIKLVIHCASEVTVISGMSAHTFLGACLEARSSQVILGWETNYDPLLVLRGILFFI